MPSKDFVSDLPESSEKSQNRAAKAAQKLLTCAVGISEGPVKSLADVLVLACEGENVMLASLYFVKAKVEQLKTSCLKRMLPLPCRTMNFATRILYNQ